MNELNVYQRLQAVMSECSYVRKDQKQIDNKYTAVKHDAVVAKVRPYLLKHGVIVVPTVSAHQIVGTWDKTNKYGDANRWTQTECEVTVSFINVDKPEDKFDVKFFGYGIDNSDKGAGKAISYAVKYALLKTLNLETGDDADDENIAVSVTDKPTAKAPVTVTPVTTPPPSVTTSQYINDAQLKRLITIQKKQSVTDDTLKAYLAGFEVTSRKLIPVKIYDMVVRWVENGGQNEPVMDNNEDLIPM